MTQSEINKLIQYINHWLFDQGCELGISVGDKTYRVGCNEQGTITVKLWLNLLDFVEIIQYDQPNIHLINLMRGLASSDNIVEAWND